MPKMITTLLQSAGLGMGSLALACLLHDERLLGADEAARANDAPSNDIRPRPGHFRSQAKAVQPLNKSVRDRMPKEVQERNVHVIDG